MNVACTRDNCEQLRTESVIANLPFYWRWYHSDHSDHTDLKQTQMDLLIKHPYRVVLSKIFHYTRRPETAVENWWLYLAPSCFFFSFPINIIIEKLETKASSRAGQCIPAGYCHVHVLLYAW